MSSRDMIARSRGSSASYIGYARIPSCSDYGDAQSCGDAILQALKLDVELHLDWIIDD